MPERSVRASLPVIVPNLFAILEVRVDKILHPYLCTNAYVAHESTFNVVDTVALMCK